MLPDPAKTDLVNSPRRSDIEKLTFVCKPIFGGEKCPQIHVVPKHIKVPQITFFFHFIRYFLTKIADNNADLWAFMSKNCKKGVVYPKCSQVKLLYIETGSKDKNLILSSYLPMGVSS